MRAYFFGNMYLSSIQQGIQASHVITEMFTKYYMEDQVAYNSAQSAGHTALYNWASNHKTIVLLNGGMGDGLRTLYNFFEFNENHEVDGVIENPYPFASFNESPAALDGALTCVGIILPEKIYAGAKELRGRVERDDWYKFKDHGLLEVHYADELVQEHYNDFERDLVQLLNKYKVAV